jgi:hypothetical protein
MSQLSYRRHRFPADIIQHAIWLYLRFPLSYRDVEELLAERGLDVSYERSCGDENARCSGSSRLDLLSVFSTSIPPSTILSTINEISSLGRRFGSSERKQPPDGKMRLPSHETGFDLANSLHSPVTVTMPLECRWR